jgi:hypothetical protein
LHLAIWSQTRYGINAEYTVKACMDAGARLSKNMVIVLMSLRLLLEKHKFVLEQTKLVVQSGNQLVCLPEL